MILSYNYIKSHGSIINILRLIIFINNLHRLWPKNSIWMIKIRHPFCIALQQPAAISHGSPIICKPRYIVAVCVTV